MTADFSPGSGTAITVAADDVEIDMCGFHIIGSRVKSEASYGIVAFNRERITVRNGKIGGYMYGVYFNDESDSVRPNGSFNGGGHLLEDLQIFECSFRGVRLEGNGCVGRRLTIRETGGCTVYLNAYAMGIEAMGPGHVYEDCVIYEVRGGGVADIGEGVGVSFSDYCNGSALRNTTISNSSLDIDARYTDWPAESRSTYAVWVGSNCDVVCDNVNVNNFIYGVTYKRDAKGFVTACVVNNALVPYYYPKSSAGINFVRDAGDNRSDMAADYLGPTRSTPGPVEFVELRYLPPR